MEFDASQNYLSLSNYFAGDRVALEGFAKMMEKSWKEEIAHGEALIDYVIKRGGNVQTPAVSVSHRNFSLTDVQNATQSFN